MKNSLIDKICNSEPVLRVMFDKSPSCNVSVIVTMPNIYETDVLYFKIKYVGIQLYIVKFDRYYFNSKINLSTFIVIITIGAILILYLKRLEYSANRFSECYASHTSFLKP